MSPAASTLCQCPATGGALCPSAASSSRIRAAPKQAVRRSGIGRESRVFAGKGAARGPGLSLQRRRNMALLRSFGPTGRPARALCRRRFAMDSTLAEKSCTPCRGGIPPLTREAAEEYHRQALDWVLLDEATRIERSYRFKTFAEAFGFVERAAALAE